MTHEYIDIYIEYTCKTRFYFQFDHYLSYPILYFVFGLENCRIERKKQQHYQKWIIASRFRLVEQQKNKEGQKNQDQRRIGLIVKLRRGDCSGSFISSVCDPKQKVKRKKRNRTLKKMEKRMN